LGPIKVILGRMSELPSTEDNFKELDTKLLQLEEEIQKNINKLNFLPESKKIQVRTNFQFTKIINGSKQNLVQCQTLFRQLSNLSKQNKNEVFQKVKKIILTLEQRKPQKLVEEI
jgi:tetrahydrodipicolinate N-succinyltransferase